MDIIENKKESENMKKLIARLIVFSPFTVFFYLVGRIVADYFKVNILIGFVYVIVTISIMFAIICLWGWAYKEA